MLSFQGHWSHWMEGWLVGSLFLCLTLAFILYLVLLRAAYDATDDECTLTTNWSLRDWLLAACLLACCPMVQGRRKVDQVFLVLDGLSLSLSLSFFLSAARGS
jgi:hypothetical protein